MFAKVTKVWAIIFFILSLFSSVVFADNDEEDIPESEKEKVDLLRVRDLGFKSFSFLKSMSASPVSTKSVGYFTAYYNNEEFTLEVEDYEGPVYVSIVGENSINEAFFVNSSGVFDIDLSGLLLGTYNLEIETKSTTYVGKLMIE